MNDAALFIKVQVFVQIAVLYSFVQGSDSGIAQFIIHFELILMYNERYIVHIYRQPVALTPFILLSFLPLNFLGTFVEKQDPWYTESLLPVFVPLLGTSCQIIQIIFQLTACSRQEYNLRLVKMLAFHIHQFLLIRVQTVSIHAH